MAGVSDILSGAFKGGTAGAALGPAGAVAGAGLGLATGLIQNIKANKAKRAADSALPQLVDPNQAAYLAEINQKRKSVDTGADFAGVMSNVDATTAGTQDAMVRAGGGDVGGTMQALLQAQQQGSAAKNQTIAGGQAQQAQLNQVYGNMLDQMAARKLQLEMLNSQQNRAEWAAGAQKGSQNVMAGLTGAAGLLAKLKKQPGQTSLSPDAGQTASPDSGMTTPLDTGAPPQASLGSDSLDTGGLANMLSQSGGAGGLSGLMEGASGLLSGLGGK
jgi:hypothetical protein